MTMVKPKSAAIIRKPKPVDNRSALAFAEKKIATLSKSGQVPDGDVRLTANIRSDLHMKLKMAAVADRTTIGDLIETMIEDKYGP
jgi:hypothetical protein